MNLNEMPQYQKNSTDEKIGGKIIQDIADLRDENAHLKTSCEEARRENALLRKKLEIAEQEQKVEYRDRVVSAMACQTCRKSEYDRQSRSCQRLRRNVCCLWGIIVILVAALLRTLCR